MGSLRKANGPLKVPRLRMKEELLKSAPELAKLLGEEIEDPEKDYNSNRLDTPRGHEEEFTEAEELHKELTSVKKDRAELIHSLAHIKTNLVGSGGGEAQTMQLIQLEKELELKKLTLNELRTEGKKLTRHISDAETQIHDAVLLTPGGYETEITTIKQLMSDMNCLEEDLIEAEAKNRLYYLLGERTRHDHLDMERNVRVAREMKNNALEDHATLTQHMHDMRAAKEEADRQLSKMKKMLEDAKKDWLKKMKDRKKEVQELKRRQEREELRELKRKERQEEDAKKEQERLRTISLEQEAHEMQIQELAPKIEAMEASWNRLRSITGADEPEEVIAYWEGLKSKEENMRQLVAASEATEANVKNKIEDLLRRRNEMLEQDVGAQSSCSAVDNLEDYEVRISDAHRKMGTTRKKFEKLRTVCISAEQGLKNMLDRVKVALQEVTAAELVPVSKIPQGTPPRPGKKLDRRESLALRKGVNSRESKRTMSPKSQDGIALDGEDVLEKQGSTQVLTLASGCNNIDDDTFFEDLPKILAEVGEKLGRLMEIEEESLQKLSAMDPTGPAPEEAMEYNSKADDEYDNDELAEEEKVGGEEAGGERDGGKVDTASGNVPDEPPAKAAEEGGEEVVEQGLEAAANGDALADTPESREVPAEGQAGVAGEDARGDGARVDAPEKEEVGGAGKAADGGQTQTPEATADAAVPDMPAAAGTPKVDQVKAAGAKPHSPHEVKPGSEAEAVLQVRDRAPKQDTTLLDSLLNDQSNTEDEDIEKRMIKMNKGMRKLDWSGAPLMDNVNPNLKGVLPPLSSLTKKTKGRKRAADRMAPLGHIVGYTEEGADEDDEDDDLDDDDDEDDDGDGVVEREAIKRMAAKMEARAAKARAEAE